MKETITPISFWFLNHLLEDDELIWQLDEIKDKGFKGVFIHPRDGLETPYLSEDWMEKVELIVNYCEQIGLHAWLYDEDPYPSGTAGGMVTFHKPEFLAKSLFMESMVSAGGKLCFDFPVGRLIKVFAIPIKDGAQRSEWIDLTSRTGIVRVNWSPSYVHHWHYFGRYEDEGNPHWRTAAGSSVYRTMAVLPTGNWKICAFVERNIVPSSRGGYADLLNPEAVRYFMELTHKRYAARFGNKFGSTIPGMFTDEPKVLGIVAWTEQFPSYFKKMFDYELTDQLPHLFMQLDGHTAQIRHDYRYALSRLFLESFIEPIAKWCQEHHLLYTGHLSPEEDPIGQTHFTPYLMSLLRPFSLPGTDLIAGLIGDEQRPLLHLGPKLVSSVAHHGGKRGAMVETFGANGWDMTIGDMQRMTDWLFVMGITDIVTHAQFYSIDGQRKREAPPSIFYQSSYWSFYETYSQRLTDLSNRLKRGKHHCHVLLYYPQSSFSAYYPDEKQKMEQLRDRLAWLQHELLANQWDFDWVDEDALLSMKLENGKWKNEISDESYDVLLLFGDFLESESVLFCKRMVDQGAEAWLLGEPPRLIQSAQKAASNVASYTEQFWSRQIVDPALITELRNTVKREVVLLEAADSEAEQVYAREVYMHTRMVGSAKLIFLVNGQKKWRRLFVHLDEAGQPKQLSLAPEGSIYLEWSKAAGWKQPLDKVANSDLYETPSVTLDISDSWNIQPKTDNVLVLADWHCSTEELLASKKSITLLPIHRLTTQPERHMQPGEHAYCRFFLDAVPAALYLVTESFALTNGITISVNGIELNTAPKRVRRYDTHNYEWNIASVLKQGLNWVTVYFPNGGVFCEPLRLYGRFLAELCYAGAMTGTIKQMDTALDGSVFSEWSYLGFPHYSGVMMYEKELVIPEGWFLKEEKAASIWLQIGNLADTARCVINGNDAGTVLSKPYAWEVTTQLHAGVNHILILVAGGTLATMEGISKRCGIFESINLVRY